MKFENRTKPNIYQMIERDSNGLITSESTVELKRLSTNNGEEDGTALSAGILNQFNNELYSYIDGKISQNTGTSTTRAMSQNAIKTLVDSYQGAGKIVYAGMDCKDVSKYSAGVYIVVPLNGGTAEGRNIFVDDHMGTGVDTGSQAVIISQHLDGQYTHMTQIFSIGGNFHIYKYDSFAYISRRSGMMAIYKLSNQGEIK